MAQPGQADPISGVDLDDAVHDTADPSLLAAGQAVHAPMVVNARGAVVGTRLDLAIKQRLRMLTLLQLPPSPTHVMELAVAAAAVRAHLTLSHRTVPSGQKIVRLLIKHLNDPPPLDADT
jgi:hypothetical protein